MEFLWNFWDGLYENGFKSSCIAPHLHYNTVSCIVDVCLLCWNDCVLVGLEWAEPMMFFFFNFFLFYCISHAHAFSCIRTLDSLYSYILIVIGAFLWVSFSPPLSLVYVSCVMAPKCKSTPSWNPLRFGASSSFDPTPSHIRFRDDKA